MNNDDDALSSVYKKIERERALLNAATQMRQQTQNESVRSRLDTEMREGRRNIQYLEERMAQLQTSAPRKTRGNYTKLGMSWTEQPHLALN
jgi:hypothetical protein